MSRTELLLSLVFMDTHVYVGGFIRELNQLIGPVFPNPRSLSDPPLFSKWVVRRWFD